MVGDNIKPVASGSSSTARAKIIAVDTAEFSGRAQDLPDLLELLRFQGVSAAPRCDAAYPDPYDEYPAAREAVHGRFATQRAAARRRPRRPERVLPRWGLFSASVAYCWPESSELPPSPMSFIRCSSRVAWACLAFR